MYYLLVLIPLCSVLILNLPFRREDADKAAWLWGLPVCAAQIVWVLSPAWQRQVGAADALMLFFRVPLVLDDAARVMLLAVGLIGLVTFMTARYAFAGSDQRFLFCNLVFLAVGGLNGIVLARDLFSLYVFIEVVVAAAAVMIAFDRDLRGLEGAFKYIVLSFVATGMMLAAIGIFFMVAGGVSFEAVRTLLEGASAGYAAQNPLVTLAVVLLLTGVFIKGGMVPFHAWLPDAYTAAPAGACVLFAGVISKATGVYVLTRLVIDVLGWSPTVTALLLCVGALSVIVGGFGALAQSDMRRMLAYSGIGQMGYIALGVGSGSLIGLAGAVFHIMNHALFSSLLFTNACAVEKQTGVRDMREMGGLGKAMPITSLTGVIGMLSGAGIPPLSGFWSKLLIVLGLWQTGHHSLAALAVLFSLVGLAYFLSLQRRVYFGEPRPSLADVQEAGFWGAAPAIVLALVTIALGVGFPWLFGTFILPIRSFL